MSDHNSIIREVEALCGELVEEVIDEPKLRRLEQLVQENFEAKRTYIKYINLYAALGHYAVGKNLSDVRLFDTSEDKTTLPLPLPETKLPFLNLPSLNMVWVPLAGVLVVLGLVGAWIFGNWKDLNRVEAPQVAKVQAPEASETIIFGKKQQDSGYVAELTWLSAAKGNDDNVPSQSNSLLAKGGVLRIQDEDVHVQFACGAEVTLHGPAVFHIESEKLARLEYGTLEAKVPPEAIGFLIDTPASRVIDLGTEFKVTVADNGNTNINVLNGEVEAEPWRPNLIGDQLRRKLFEGDSLELSPPVTESFRVDFDTPDSLEVFDIVRHDPTTCILDPTAGLLTLKSQKGSIYEEQNSNNNILVVPIPNRDFDAVLTVKRFEPQTLCNHLSLATFNDQNNIYRISYWFHPDNDLNPDGKRSFVCTTEENARHGFVQDANGIQEHLSDMKDRPFRLRIMRKNGTISTYWSEESGTWFSSGEVPCQCELRFVGFFVAEGQERQKSAFTDCIIDSFEVNLSPSDPQNK